MLNRDSVNDMTAGFRRRAGALGKVTGGELARSQIFNLREPEGRKFRAKIGCFEIRHPSLADLGDASRAEVVICARFER